MRDRKSTRNLVQPVEALHPVAGCQAKATKLERGLVHDLDRPPRALTDMKAWERREKLLSQRRKHNLDFSSGSLARRHMARPSSVLLFWAGERRSEIRSADSGCEINSVWTARL